MPTAAIIENARLSSPSPLKVWAQQLPVTPRYQRLADLDGAEAARWLTAHGFEVVGHANKGTHGEAWTTCGLHLSTNGWMWMEPAEANPALGIPQIIKLDNGPGHCARG